jgi:hypothetical protein
MVTVMLEPSGDIAEWNDVKNEADFPWVCYPFHRVSFAHEHYIVAVHTDGFYPTTSQITVTVNGSFLDLIDRSPIAWQAL